jgi:crotonobetainyl-CoA:carnitine CoA-transferase CaiB-like acyl-CoA transferase
MTGVRLPPPLEGVRVLDLGREPAAAFGSQMLADLGAEVIRVQPADGFADAGPAAALSAGDGGEGAGRRFSPFDATARNKLGITVDLLQPAGRDVLRRLVAVADVLVTDIDPATMDELGVGYDALAEVNPGLIHVVSTPSRAPGPGRDASASAIALAAQSALYARERTGVGQYVEVSPTANLLGLAGTAVLDRTVNGRVERRTANRDLTVLQGCYPCAGDDRWLVVTIADDRDWAGLVGALGEPGWALEPRFATVHGRRRHQDEVDERIAAWTRARDRDDAIARLRAAGVAAGPVQDDAAVHADPHLAQRGFFLELAGADAGGRADQGMPYRFARAPLTARLPPARLGEHNREVYRELLGVGEEEYRRLEAEGHIATERAPRTS